MPVPRDLFPPLEPYTQGTLQVDERHKIYWEECGNPNGVPVVFLHGGPGAGCVPAHRRFFDPDFFRIILFDQRGSGRSRPLYELRDNTTEHLIADIEALRRYREIPRWHVFGGSWGSTLALCYAQAHPESCLSLILRGIFLGSQQEIDWFLYGMRNFFPEAWEKFVAPLTPAQRADILESYYQILTGSDETRKQQARLAWLDYETSCATLAPPPPSDTPDEIRAITALPVMEAHYFRNNRFVPDTKILDRIDIIRHIPAVIVHGRYDILCPVATMYELKKRWPEATYRIIPDAGHSAFEPSIRTALVEATEALKSL